MKRNKTTFTNRNVVNAIAVYELDTWSRTLNTKFTLGDCVFGAVKLTKSADPRKCGYRGYGIRFDAGSQYSLPIGEWGKNVIFGV